MFWTIRMTYQLKKYGYEKTWADCLSLARDDCFQDYRRDGYTPREAVLEDLSYA
jgi:hypothetical protein